MSKLTDAMIRNVAAPSSGRITMTDGGGLQLRVTPNGIKSWSLQYRFDAQNKKVTLGQYPALSLREARRLALGYKLAIAKGVDPNKEKAEARLRAVRNDSFAAVFRVYAQLHISKLKETTGNEYLRAFERDIIPTLGRIPIGELKRQDVIRLIDKVAGRAPILANRILTYTRAFCSWSVGRGYLEQNPTHGIPKPYREHARDRVLALSEVQALYHAAAKVLGPEHCDVFQFLILSCLRRSEACKLEWREVFEDRLRIAASRSKNHRSFDVPRTRAIDEIIGRQMTKDGTYVFSSTSGSQPITLTDKMKVRVSRESGIDGWRFHDFRRAATTFMEDNGINRFVTERVLSHADVSTTGIYARSDYFEAKHSALALWEKHVLNLGQYDRIVTLGQRIRANG